MTGEEAVTILKNKISACLRGTEWGEALNMAIKALEQKLKTGRWVKTTDDYIYFYVCSVCGERIPKNDFGNDYFSPFCPECGAKMRGELDG